MVGKFVYSEVLSEDVEVGKRIPEGQPRPGIAWNGNFKPRPKMHDTVRVEEKDGLLEFNSVFRRGPRNPRNPARTKAQSANAAQRKRNSRRNQRAEKGDRRYLAELAEESRRRRKIDSDERKVMKEVAQKVWLIVMFIDFKTRRFYESFSKFFC